MARVQFLLPLLCLLYPKTKNLDCLYLLAPLTENIGYPYCLLIPYTDNPDNFVVLPIMITLKLLPSATTPYTTLYRYNREATLLHITGSNNRNRTYIAAIPEFGLPCLYKGSLD